MSIGSGKNMRLFRNQAHDHARQRRQVDDLKARFGNELKPVDRLKLEHDLRKVLDQGKRQ